MIKLNKKTYFANFESVVHFVLEWSHRDLANPLTLRKEKGKREEEERREKEREERRKEKKRREKERKNDEKRHKNERIDTKK